MNYNKMMDAYFGFYNMLRRKIIQKSDRRQCMKRISGKVTLSKEQKKKIKDFYAPYCKTTTMFHQMYYEKTGVFSEKYIPIDIYTNVIDEYFNPRAESKYMDNKCYYHSMFNGIRQPEFAVMRVGGFWYDGEMNFISFEEAKKIVSEEKELFVKAATESYGGKGVMYISSEDERFLENFTGFVQGAKCDIIAQRALKQHKDLAAVNESSVNTIRMISLLSENGPKIYSSVFRMGLKGKKVDNCSSGGIAAGIDEDGALKEYAYTANGERFSEHPSNGFVFKGYKMPSFEKVKELVMRAHLMVPHFRLVSFDVAVQEDGEPVLIEANLCKGMIEFHEFNNGPLFGEDTKEILDEVFGVKRGRKSGTCIC